MPGLHFEACYYQAIEFCIERGIACFEGGAQGVHKLARGLLPVATHSLHAIADRAFATAIADYCARERVDVAHSIDELEARSPFRGDARPHDATGSESRMTENNSTKTHARIDAADARRRGGEPDAQPSGAR